MRLKEARGLFLEEIRPRRIRKIFSFVTSDFISYVGNLRINDISTQNLREYISFLSRRPKLSVKRYSILRKWLQWCLAERLFDFPIAEVDELFMYLRSQYPKSHGYWLRFPAERPRPFFPC